MFKTVGRRGTCEEDPQHQRCYCRRSGRRFPERGCILERQIFRFAKVILRDRCSTAWPGITVSWQCSTLDKWNGIIAKRFGTRPSALHSTFRFWIQPFRIWGSLAELLRSWRCQVQKMRKSGKIAAFLMLSSSKTEEVSQNSFVFKLADRQIDRGTTTPHYSYNYTTTSDTATATTTTTPTLQLLQLLQLHFQLHFSNTTATSTALQLQQHQLHYNYNYITNTTTTTTTTTTTLQVQLQIQIQLHCTSLCHTTSWSCGWGGHCNYSKIHNHLRSISGFALPSIHHNNSPLL